MSTAKKKITYSEVIGKRSSSIWKNFLRGEDGQSAQCKNCKKVLKTGGGSTTGLHTHLRTVHSNLASTETENSSSSSGSTSTGSHSQFSTASTHNNEPGGEQKKRKLITDYISTPCNSMEVVVARMAALDGVSFRLFSESDDLRQLFNKSGYDIPKSANTISKIVLTQAEEIKGATKKKILDMKNAGHRFTLSLDEWTSLRNKRYMNINLHCKAFGGFNFKNLGLIKITGSMTALTAFNILEDHLATFNVSLQNDIICQTTDGASVMVKMGTYFEGYHQLCLAHGIQLAVIDTLYKNTKEPEPVTIQMTLDDSDSDEEEDHYGGFVIETTTARAEPKMYKEVIEKVRRLVKTIRKSPLKADALRAYTSKEYREDIQLQLDCKTRWSSLSDMIGVFLKIKDSVFKALIDWKSDISFSEHEIQILRDIHCSLNVIKVTVLTLCRRDSNLHTADVALRFMLKKLDEENSTLSSKLATNLRSRIKERRLQIAGVLHYLHDSEDFFSQMNDDETFRKPTNEEMTEIIVKLLRHLTNKTNINEPSTSDLAASVPSEREITASSDCDTIEEPGQTLTIQEQLNRELYKCRETRKNERGDFDLRGFVGIEKAMYDNGGDRGVYLTKAYEYLMCILPTSVESERIFSSAGYFCNRLRSSLSDKMLDSLSFLRTHFQEQRFLAKK